MRANCKYSVLLELVTVRLLHRQLLAAAAAAAAAAASTSASVSAPKTVDRKCWIVPRAHGWPMTTDSCCCCLRKEQSCSWRARHCSWHDSESDTTEQKCRGQLAPSTVILQRQPANMRMVPIASHCKKKKKETRDRQYRGKGERKREKNSKCWLKEGWASNFPIAILLLS